MPYTRNTWVNNTTPAISAANLNNLTDELEWQAGQRSVAHTLPTWADGVAPAVSDQIPLDEMERVLAAVATSLGLSYTVTNWSDGWVPARNAANLNKMELQAVANRNAIDAAVTTKYGVGYIRYAGGALDAHASQYDLRVLSRRDNGASAVAPNIHYVCGKHLISQVTRGFNYGVSVEEARDNNWVLKDSGGNELYSGATVWDSYLADVGVVGYQQRFCDNVLANLVAWGAEGFMNDECDGGEISSFPMPAKYPTATAWHDAMLSFCVYVGNFFQSRGYKVAHNAGRFIAGDPNSNNSVNKKSWWTDLGPHSDYLLDEGWMFRDHTDNPNQDDLRLEGSQFWNNWTAYQGLLDHAYSVGVEPICLTYGTTTLRQLYGMASFFLDWEPAQGGVFIWANPNYNTGNVCWGTGYDNLPLGNPTGIKVKTGNQWRRDYTGGYVLVDPVAGTASVVYT